MLAAQAGLPTTTSTNSAPPVIVPDTAQSLMTNYDIASLPAIISLPAPIKPPTIFVESEISIITSSTLQPTICAGISGS